MLELAKSMYRAEGAASFYRGLYPTLAGILPYAGMAFFIFQRLKAEVRSKSVTGELLWWERLACGGLAGLVAQSSTYPLDVIRRRMQTESALSPGVSNEKGKRFRYRSIRGTLLLMIKEEGWLSLYRGLTVNWVKTPIAVGISFSVNDKMKSFFEISEDT